MSQCWPISGFNRFHVTGRSPHPLKTSECVWFSDVSKGSRKRRVTSNGSITFFKSFCRVLREKCTQIRVVISLGEGETIDRVCIYCVQGRLANKDLFFSESFYRFRWTICAFQVFLETKIDVRYTTCKKNRITDHFNFWKFTLSAFTSSYFQISP